MRHVLLGIAWVSGRTLLVASHTTPGYLFVAHQSSDVRYFLLNRVSQGNCVTQRGLINAVIMFVDLNLVVRI